MVILVSGGESAKRATKGMKSVLNGLNLLPHELSNTGNCLDAIKSLDQAL